MNQADVPISETDEDRLPQSFFVRLASLLFFYASAMLFFRNAWLLRNLAIDDSYITYRFAWRLAKQGTLRWNMLEAPVEGYTSFLSVLLSAPFIWLGIDPIEAWKYMGIGFIFGGAALTVWGGRQFCRLYFPKGLRLGLPLFVGALWLMNPLNGIHAMSGMETALHAFLLTACAALAIYIFRRQKETEETALLPMRLYIAPGIGFLLLGMTRPESLLWSALIIAGLLIGLRPSERMRFLRALLLSLILPGAIYFIARWIYFGNMLPSTFHAKAASAGSSELGRLHSILPSLHDILKYIRRYWALFLSLYAAVGLILLWRRGRQNISASLRAALPWFFFLAASFACIGFFAHIHMLMGYAWRFLYPYGQTLWLLLVLPSGVLLLRLVWDRRSHARFFAAAAVFLVLCTLSMASIWRDSFGTKGGNLLYYNARQSNGFYSILRHNTISGKGYRKVGREIDKMALAEGPPLTLFHHNMGELMFFAPHWDSIDPVGLVDAQVAHHGFSVDHVFNRDPDLLILPSKSKSEITRYNAELFPDISKSVYQDSRMADYRYLGYYPHIDFGASGKMHFFLRRRLAEKYPEIVENWKENLELKITEDSQIR
ncbi:MAG: hypothetical protein ACLFUS_02410 [Candidatus Sumerlaeia bacterium]